MSTAETRVSVEIAGSEISFETGKMAKQASGAVGLEAVGVAPQRVGPGALLVDEAVRRLPVGDLRQPAHRDAADAQPVADQRPLAHRDRLGRDDAKAQQRRRQRLEVARRREEVEHLLRGTRQALLAPDDLHVLDGGHRSAT